MLKFLRVGNDSRWDQCWVFGGLKSWVGSFTFVPGMLESHGRALSREGTGSNLGLEGSPSEPEEGKELAELLGGAGGSPPSLKELTEPQGVPGIRLLCPSWNSRVVLL